MNLECRNCFINCEAYIGDGYVYYVCPKCGDRPAGEGWGMPADTIIPPKTSAIKRLWRKMFNRKGA